MPCASRSSAAPALALSAAVVSAWLVGCAPEGSSPQPTACNGHEALCDRALDEVTLPGTHNSMSNADAGWMVANQQHGLTRQLEDGVRALMLDTYEWNGELYLCHGYCDLGAQPLSEGLGEIAGFLEANPREVVLIIFQDAISVEDTVGALEEAGLAELAWTWEPEAGALPTLGGLVSADTRLIVSAESKGPPPAWYHHAWDLVFDTPYDFASAEEFSCELNRGSGESPLFLVNHWLSTPLPTAEGASEVNVSAVLGERARECEETWGRRINVLAVDFYDRGDLFEVVDELNGVGSESAHGG